MVFDEEQRYPKTLSAIFLPVKSMAGVFAKIAGSALKSGPKLPGGLVGGGGPRAPSGGVFGFFKDRATKAGLNVNGALANIKAATQGGGNVAGGTFGGGRPNNGRNSLYQGNSRNVNKNKRVLNNHINKQIANLRNRVSSLERRVLALNKGNSVNQNRNLEARRQRINNLRRA